MKKIARYARFIWILLKLRLSRAMAFRFVFFNAFFVDGGLFLVQMLMFSAIYGNVDSIGGWGRGETLLFVGTFSLINALNMLIFFFGINSLNEKIQTGDLDGYLTKPFPTLLRLSFENIDLGSLPLVLLSVGIIVYAARQLTITVTAGAVIGYILLTLLMVVLWYDMMVILRTIAFFTISISSIQRLEGTVLDMAMRIPGVAFQGAFKVIFMVLLPYGLMGTVPVEWFTGALTNGGLIYSLAVVVIFTAFMLWFFRQGVRNYKSASS